MFLLRFLNANLETFETAYETFFFAYGFELLKELDNNYSYLSIEYPNDLTLYSIAAIETSNSSANSLKSIIP